MFLLTGTLLAEFLTTATCTLINFLLDRLRGELNIFPCNGSFLIEFLEHLIVDIFKIDCKAIIKVRNRPFSIFSACDKHLIVLGS